MNRWDTGRIEAFSPIAITLLVLDIDVPPSSSAASATPTPPSCGSTWCSR